jgi:DNA mismatch repair protein MutS
MIRSSDPSSLTPMLQQYFAAKESHPAEVLLFRMGDFYEMFFEDASICAEILGITLTARGKDRNGTDIPMAGIPVRAIDSYLPRLLRAGKRVAICEQVQDPRDAKGIVERQVVRVITPGTVTDESVIGERSHHYIASLSVGSRSMGLSWVDLSTGLFVIDEVPDARALATALGRLSPAEIVVPETVEYGFDERSEIFRAVADYFRTSWSDTWFDPATAHRTLTDHFATRTLEGFGCEHLRTGMGAAGALLKYLQETQKVGLRHITRVQAYQSTSKVPIDRATRRALELTETSRDGDRRGGLLASFDHTATSLGARLLKDWMLAPLTDVAAIVARQDGVAALLESPAVRDELAALLRKVHDLERLSTRLSYGSANGRDLLALARTLEVLPAIRGLLERTEASILRHAASLLHDHPELAETISKAIVSEPPIAVREGGIFRTGYDAELDELREISQEGKRWFARFQQREIERTGIHSLKVGYTRVFGYYVEVTNAHREKIPVDYVRKQTLKNCERYITPDLKEYENKVLHARERSAELEYEKFSALRDRASADIASFQESAAALAEIDVLCTFARLAEQRGYVRPVVNNGTRLWIEDGRHPVVEEVATTEPFIANSVDLDDDHRIMIITGPNMAGKSTYIRQVAILTLLAQIGSFIPAKRAEIGVADRIFTRVGASDDLSRGQSTFMVEMHETANILNNATERSLIVLDEVGRGTSTFDGVSLAWAITEHIAETTRARTLFATHYHELTGLARTFPTAVNYNFAVKEWNDEIIFLRRVIPGGADKSYGIHVARLAGIPKAVIDRAREILGNLENQELDIHDQPAIAKSQRRRLESFAEDGGAASRQKSLQLDFFHSTNDKILEELKRIDVERTTPLEAIQILASIKTRIV